MESKIEISGLKKNSKKIEKKNSEWPQKSPPLPNVYGQYHHFVAIQGQFGSIQG